MSEPETEVTIEQRPVSVTNGGEETQETRGTTMDAKMMQSSDNSHVHDVINEPEATKEVDQDENSSQDKPEEEELEPAEAAGEDDLTQKPLRNDMVDEKDSPEDVNTADIVASADVAFEPEETNEEDQNDCLSRDLPEEEEESQPTEAEHTQEDLTHETLSNSEAQSDSAAPSDNGAEETEDVDIAATYSWFADNLDDEEPNNVAEGGDTIKQHEEEEKDTDVKEQKHAGECTSESQSQSPKEIEDSTGENTPCQDTNGDVSKPSTDEKPPRAQRNSLIGRIKTVNEDGDTDEEDEENRERKADEEEEDPWMIPDSDLRDPNRRICVVTTAALPWRTGTAVNPLLRALYLTRGRPKHYVTLVIPWCQEEDDRNKTLGKQYSFANQQEQEEWIRDFCRTRANCEEEEKNLKIMFYPSNYNEGMGSIFPSVDICSLIPEKEADIAILEEPEHLNWMRVPEPYKEQDSKKASKTAKRNDSHSSELKGKIVATAKEKAELGWRFKFRHVVGIIHTNYKAYAEQYGIGAKFITAPALCALNALVVRAYCHKVILLSGTLPSLTPYKEITCNVHGVRGEFLERPSDATAEEQKGEEEEHAPVYFIGKLIWAKGFDKVLELENLYREKHDDYFPIDVYGAGGDAKAIKRAFFGRIPQIQKGDSSSDEEKATPSDTAEVFTWEASLRSHLVENTPFKESEQHQCLDDHLAKRRSIIDPDEVEGPPEPPKKSGSVFEDFAEKVVPLSVLGNLSVSALDTTKATGGAAVEMVKNVVGAGLNVAFTNDVGSPKRNSRANGKGPGSPSKKAKQKLIFDPPKSIFEFRRNPIQARFLGTKDHVLLRDITAHKIFLNMSVTEVLCTTSAEAMAMGKFVILPKHPSNTFFLQFPNCLAYTSLEDCLEKVDWALANDPVALSEEDAKKLSWEGANKRLFDSAAVTRDEWEEWAETGKLKSDADAARFHAETGMKGQLIGKFFLGNKKKEGSQAQSQS